MRRRRLPLLPRLHRWIGIGLAAWIVLAAASGSLLLFADAWLRLRLPAMPAMEEAAAPAWPEAATITRTLEGAGGAVESIELPRRGAPWLHVRLADGTERLLDPSDGSLLALHTPGTSLVAFLFDLHARLLAGNVGHRIVGVLGLLLAGTMLAGLALWLRRRRAFDLRRVAVADVTPAAVLRSHVAQGVLASALLLAVALTGASLVFPSVTGALLESVLGGGRGTARPTVTDREGPAGPMDWAAVLAAGESAFPASRLRVLMPPADGLGVAVLRVRTPGDLHPQGSSHAVLDPVTGTLLERIDAREGGPGPTVLDALYPLHAGSTGWLGHRWVLLLGAFVLLRLVTTSLWLQGDRRTRKRKLQALAQAGPPAVGGSGRIASAARPASQPIGR